MERSLSLRGLHIRYLQSGDGDPVVLLHGFSFLAETWVEMGLFDALAARYRTYSFDMPYGAKSRSDKLDTQDRDEYAEFLFALMTHLDIRDPALIGASISGEVTLRYLLRGHPARVSIVVGPAGLQNLEPLLGSIRVPLLGIWGDRDTISPPSGAQILTSRIKTASVRTIEGAGHACYLDDPPKFTPLVLEFLQENY